MTPDFFSKEIKLDLLKLGIYQIGGAVIGFSFLVMLFFSSIQINASSILLVVLSLLFFGYSAYCGFLCIKERENSIRHSKINQLVQILGFNFFGFAFQYISGIFLKVEANLTDGFNFNLGFGVSKIKFALFDRTDTISFQVNVVAICIVLWIEKITKEIKSNREFRRPGDILENN